MKSDPKKPQKSAVIQSLIAAMVATGRSTEQSALEAVMASGIVYSLASDIFESLRK